MLFSYQNLCFLLIFSLNLPSGLVLKFPPVGVRKCYFLSPSRKFVQSVVMLMFDSVPKALPTGPEPGLVGQLTIKPKPGLLLFCQVGELNIPFIYIRLPANFLSAQPESQGHSCVIDTTEIVFTQFSGQSCLKEGKVLPAQPQPSLQITG